MRNGLDKGIDVEVLDRRRHDLVVKVHKLVGCLKLLHDLCGVGLIGLVSTRTFLERAFLTRSATQASPLPIGLVASIKKRDNIDIVQLEQRALVQLGP